MFDASMRPSGLRLAQTWSLVIIAGLLLVTSLRLAESFVAPIALGLVLSLVLAPSVSILQRMGVPRAVSATAALLMAGFLAILLIALLGPILIDAMQQMPRVEQEIQMWLRNLTYSVRGLEGVRDEIERSISEGGENAVPTIIDMMWMAPDFLGQTLIFAGTVFFFLMTRDDIYARFERFNPSLKKADRAVSHYFVTITMINAGLGIATGLVMMALGVSYPMIWGFVAFMLNFLLYLGPIALIGALTVAGITQFNGFYSFLPPLSFLALNLTEAQFVTPFLVGQRLQINPLGIFLGILFGLWLWGPIGGIVAIPFMIWLTTFWIASPRFTAPQEQAQPV
ncbi:AI-2E family transporter [Primorskyibacter sp. 2E107]|uniref:AI-2E family transporter n=1 Tax=Primorskyibacter sp. 2E107 TaxID=3403458 RepID=UPI003AF9C612